MAKSPDRISGIAVSGYKSICDRQHIDVAPLTILAGANSSGKSSMMQPLLLLKQTLDASGDPGALLLDGPNVRFTLANQLFSHIQGRDGVAEFSVRMDLSKGRSIELVFRRGGASGVDIVRMLYADEETSITVTPGMRHDAIDAILPKGLRDFREDFQKSEKQELRWSARQDRCFLTFELVSKEEPKRRVAFPHGVSPGFAFVPHIQRIIHIPGVRGNPRRTYPRTAVGPDFPGTFEQYVASVIAQWQADDSERLKALGAALETMGLTWKVRATRVDDTQVELQVGRLPHARRGGARDLVNIAEVGFGVSQVLPVIVSLIAARPGQMVYLEQPEIHLHPMAQRRLAGILSSAVERGVVAVVETHSALLLREIQTLVATGVLDRKKVKLHWLQRDPDGGTVVATADLDKTGAYGDWPEDFDLTELEAEQAYLDAVERRGAGK